MKKNIYLGISRLEKELELNLVSAIATMPGLESKEHNTSFDRVRFFVKLLIIIAVEKGNTFTLGGIEYIIQF